MKKQNRYVFGAALAGASLAGVSGLVSRANAALVTQADFTFETSGVPLNAANVTGSSVGPLSAEVGTGSAFGSHFFTASAGSTSPTSTVWSSPAGNGSPRSLSANHWGSGDYYQFNVPTTGIQGIILSLDQTSSSTGPKAFTLFYSTDGTNFVSESNYSPLVNAAGTTGTLIVSAWGAPPSQPAFNVSFDLSAITALDNNSNAEFRIVDNDTTTATAGTDRIDNVVVAGNAVPEPASLSLLTMAAAVTLLRRKRTD